SAGPVGSTPSSSGLPSKKSRTNSRTLPCMSCSPNAFGGSSPTACSRPPEFSANQPTFARSASVFPLKYAVVVPARHAYSHCASVGSCTVRPTCADILLQNASASCHETLCTGRLPPTVLLGLAPAIRSYCACVSSYLPM